MSGRGDYAPAPWEVVGDLIVSATHGEVARVNAYYEQRHRNEATAHLLAAAPQLLDTLELALALISSGEPISEQDAGWVSHLAQSVILRARNFSEIAWTGSLTASLWLAAPALYAAAVEIEEVRVCNERFDELLDPSPEEREALDLRIAKAFDGLRAAIAKAGQFSS